MSKSYRADDHRLPFDPPADALPLDTMAVVDAFADAYERGAAPALSEWLRRYPEHAGALADYAATLFGAPETPGMHERAEQTSGELAPGAQHALDAIFGAPTARWSAGSLPRVAEPPANYDTRPTEPSTDLFALAEAHGLDVAQFARAVGVSDEELARALTAAEPGALVARARGDGVPETILLEEAIRRSEALSVEQRARWLDLLERKDTGALEGDGER